LRGIFGRKKAINSNSAKFRQLMAGKKKLQRAKTTPEAGKPFETAFYFLSYLPGKINK